MLRITAWLKKTRRPRGRSGLATRSLLAGCLLTAALAAGMACRSSPEAVSAAAMASLTGSGLAERAQMLPVYADLGPGARRVRVAGVESTRRVSFDPATGRVHEIQLALAEPLLVFSGPKAGAGGPPRVALTFDDGPSATYTPQVLQIMRQHGAQVTFFVLGCCAVGQQGLIRQAAEEGHEIGIHSWSHPQYTKLSDAAIAADLARCQALLDPLVEQPIRWMRPPYGDHNKRVDAAINAAGYRVAMWSVDPRDWTAPGASVVASRVLSQVRDGSVVVMHDGGARRGGTVAAMRMVVPELQRRGFRLVTMSQLAGIEPEERGMLLTIGDEQFRIEGGLEDIKVLVNGVEAPLATPPMKTRGQFLLQARPVLTALGAVCTWHGESLTLELDAPRGHFLVRLNSQQMVVDGREVFVQVPAVFYHDKALLPAWMIANACRATVAFNETARTIEFTSVGGLQAGPRSFGHGDLIARRGFDGMSVCGAPYQPWSL